VGVASAPAAVASLAEWVSVQSVQTVQISTIARALTNGAPAICRLRRARAVGAGSAASAPVAATGSSSKGFLGRPVRHGHSDLRRTRGRWARPCGPRIGRPA